MMLSGIMQILEGLAALLKGQFFVVAANYAFKIDVTTWGWIHLIWGIIVLLAGFNLLGSWLLGGSVWAGSWWWSWQGSARSRTSSSSRTTRSGHS